MQMPAGCSKVCIGGESKTAARGAGEHSIIEKPILTIKVFFSTPHILTFIMYTPVRNVTHTGLEISMQLKALKPHPGYPIPI